MHPSQDVIAIIGSGEHTAQLSFLVKSLLAMENVGFLFDENTFNWVLFIFIYLKQFILFSIYMIQQKKSLNFEMCDGGQTTKYEKLNGGFD